MFRQTIAFARLFTKVTVSNKIAVLWSLVLPLIVFVATHTAWMGKSPAIQHFYFTEWFYLSYVLVSTSLNGLGFNLVQMRDTGFLKMYQYIAGAVLPIVLGEFLAQALLVTSEVIVFTTVASLVFREALASPLGTALLLVVLAWMPLSMLFTIIAVMPIRTASMAPLLNLLVAPLLYWALTSVHHLPNEGSALVASLNPVMFVVAIAQRLTTAYGPPRIGAILLGSVGLGYLIIGGIS